jgi:hypothetical protein
MAEMVEDLAKMAKMVKMATPEKDKIAKVERQATAKTLEMAEVRDARDGNQLTIPAATSLGRGRDATLGDLLGRPDWCASLGSGPHAPTDRRPGGCWCGVGREVLKHLLSGCPVSGFGGLSVVTWLPPPHQAPDLGPGEPFAGWRGRFRPHLVPV